MARRNVGKNQNFNMRNETRDARIMENVAHQSLRGIIPKSFFPFLVDLYLQYLGVNPETKIKQKKEVPTPIVRRKLRLRPIFSS